MYILGILWLPDSVLWLLVLFIALYVYSTWTHNSLAAYGYKGPKPKPFIGNYDLLFREHFGSWDGEGKKLYGKVFSFYEGRFPTVVTFDPEMIKEVAVKQFSNFVDRRDLAFRGNVVSLALTDIKGAHWKRIRTLTTPFFTTGKLRKNMPCLEKCVKNLMKQFEKYSNDQESFDVKDVVGTYTMEAICLTAFGVEVDSLENPDHPILVSAKRMVNFNPTYWGFFVGVAFPFMVPFLEWLGCTMWPKDSVETMNALARELVSERRKNTEERPDFLQMLLNVHEEDVAEEETDGVVADSKNKPLTEDEIVAQVDLFLLAGYDTTSTVIAFLLFLLAIHQDCQDKVVQEINDVIGDGEVTFDKIKEMTYLNMCLEETQRMYPSIFRTDRKCVRDTTVLGHFIPKGTLVVTPIVALHRDPEFWDDPDAFDPERFSAENRHKINPYVYQPFGAGPRNCVGMRLAQLEVRYAAIHILRRYSITVASKAQLPIKLAKGLFAKVSGGMWIDANKR